MLEVEDVEDVACSADDMLRIVYDIFFRGDGFTDGRIRVQMSRVRIDGRRWKSQGCRRRGDPNEETDSHEVG